MTNRVRGCPVWGGLARSVLAGVFFAFAVVGCSGKGEKRKDAQREKVCAPVANDQPASPPLDLPTETKRGEELLDWEARSHLRETTKVKMEEEFQKLKGEYVVISGKVMDVKVHNGKTFVSLENGRYPYHSYHGIAFYIPDSLKPTVAKWSKGEVHVMRGRVTHGWFSVPLLNVFSTQCDRGQIVVDGKVFVPMADEKAEKPAAKRELSETEGDAPPLDLPTEIQQGEQMLAWSKAARKNMTTLQSQESFPALKGMYVVVSGKVTDVDTKKGETYVSLRVDWDCHEIGFIVPRHLKSTVANWAKDEEHVMRGRVIRCTWGEFVNRIYCDRSELVPEDKFRAANGLSSDKRRKSAR